MSSPPLQCRIDSVSACCSLPITVDVLRLDLLHPVVSGNKWFKLKGHMAAAKAQGKTSLLTFGGAYSNHLVATAAAAQLNGLKSIGIVRGEEPKTLSPTLLTAKEFGMNLHFVSREKYRDKNIPTEVYEGMDVSSVYPIPEGGYGALGMAGARDILLQNDTASYTHVLTAVGTGTTLAGLTAASLSHQNIIGIPVLKNAPSLRQEIETLLPEDRREAFALIQGYHFGGYAKHPTDLLTFMNGFYAQTGIPTDFVYTGKAVYAAFDLIGHAYIPAGSRLLIVHTGGLQGNASLKKGTLSFA